MTRVRAVPGAEEALAALAAHEHLRVVLVPAEPLTGLESPRDLRLGAQRRKGELEGTGREQGSVRVAQGERLLLGEVVGGVVLNVAARRLAAQPLLRVAGVVAVRSASSCGRCGFSASAR